jgi:hypothetical protein
MPQTQNNGMHPQQQHQQQQQQPPPQPQQQQQQQQHQHSPAQQHEQMNGVMPTGPGQQQQQMNGAMGPGGQPSMNGGMPGMNGMSPPHPQMPGQKLPPGMNGSLQQQITPQQQAEIIAILSKNPNWSSLAPDQQMAWVQTYVSVYCSRFRGISS